MLPVPYNRADYEASDNVALAFGTLRCDYPLELMTLPRREPRERDIVIEILYCGVCHSDWHVLKNEWNSTKYPIVTGHEIVGAVSQVGSAAHKYRVGDLVALGPNYDSCKQCDQCRSGLEQYCENDVTETYNMPDRLPGELKPTGPITQGGFSSYIVADERYVLRVPTGAPLHKIAPLVCAGATMWTPLTTLQVSKGWRVGIAGYGGLGNIGTKLAHSMGAETIVLSTTQDKLTDAASKGADEALWMLDLDLLDDYRGTFDLIVCTIPFRHDMDKYIELLKIQGTLWIVGAMVPLTLNCDKMNRKGKIVRGSSTAGIASTQECIDYCVKHGLYPDVELIHIGQLNATREAIVTRQVRYRYVVDMQSIHDSGK